MANRFWTGAVNGGTGTWDASNTANWSTATGGAGGASVPTSADDVFFDANSGSGTCTLGSNVVFRLINFSAYTGTIDFSTFKMSSSANGTTIVDMGSTVKTLGSKRIELTYSGSVGTRTITGLGPEADAVDFYITAGSDAIGGGIRCRNLDFTGFSGSVAGVFQFIFGDLIMSPTMTTTGTSPFVFSSTSATPRTITTNGVLFNFNMRFNGVGGSWVFQDNVSISSLRQVELFNGTLDLNGKNVSSGGFTSNAGTKTLKMRSGTWTVTGSTAGLGFSPWNAGFSPAGLTLEPGSSTITMTNAAAKTFSGGNVSYNVLDQGGAGTLTISGSNTFSNITNSVQPATVTFTSGTTQTVTNFSLSGTSGNLITINSSTPGSAATISDPSGGINRVSFCSITDITATGAGIWKANPNKGNVNGGGNTGWSFSTTDYAYVRRKNKVF